MTSIPLRSYNREIENLVDNGQIDEAIAYCRHILQIYPKHIDTYRLLGKAYLENQHYSDAADIFQRVLSAIPDDFVSHVGMSIIREDEGNLDAAIWHMERAFEAQPANTAIQDELRRLYGRRDGLEPPKVRLTRGALSRMYAKGDLYQQAIGELRAALADDPDRPDLQTLLAHVYGEAGWRVEAVGTCSNLLKKLPYCLEVNRILSVILPDTERAEDTQIYHQRVVALDPYFQHALPRSLTSDGVPDNAVTIEKLEWKPGQPVAGAPSQPAWATTLGVTVAEEGVKALPEWLTTEGEAISAPKEEEEISVSAVAPFSPEAIPTPEEAIPDWMKEAGWTIKSGETEEALDLFKEEEVTLPEGELAPADIPDWLRDMAPSGLFETPAQPTEEKAQEEAIPWLQETPPGPTDSIVTWLEEKEEGEIQPLIKEQPETPGWVEGIPPEAPTETISQLPQVEGKPSPEVTPVEEAKLPEWLTEPTQPSTGPETAPVPDWLQETVAPAREEGVEELPEWMREPAVGEAAGEISAPVEEIAPQEAAISERTQPAAEVEPVAPPATEIPTQTPSGINLVEQAAALAWLESLAAKQGVPEEELITRPEERIETPPTWVQEVAAEQVTTPVEAEITQPPAETVPEYPEQAGEIPISEVPTTPPVAEELITQETDVSGIVQPEELVIPEAIELSETQPTKVAPILPPETITPVVEKPTEVPGGINLEDQEAALAWLESLAAKQGASEEELITHPEDRLETPPAWIQEITSAEAKTPTGTQAPSEKPVEAEAELPEWLSESTKEEILRIKEVPTTPVEEKTGVTDWLQSHVDLGLIKKLEKREAELPTWIATPAEEAKPEEEYTWLSPAEQEEITAISPEIREQPQPTEQAIPTEVPVLRIDLNKASLSELERLPDVGFILAQNILAYRDNFGPFSSVEDLANISGIGSSMIDELKPYLMVAPSEKVIHEEKGPEQAQDEDQAILSQARSAIIRGDTSDASNLYQHLMKKGVHLKDIILDLEDALYRFPVDINIWQTLGDAYMQNNQLQEALNAYTKAEELLR